MCHKVVTEQFCNRTAKITIELGDEYQGCGMEKDELNKKTNLTDVNYHRRIDIMLWKRSTAWYNRARNE